MSSANSPFPETFLRKTAKSPRDDMIRPARRDKNGKI
jgi:hypothetical protein